ncbi:MAG: hydantoinase B/oxoprolinase family protein [Rhodospirillaceae bacterium]|jgi:N-methylhydantoinase B|nr:hydantoinase B/oxoprolinase family protein [Rhodospirillaceae bacterium]MBT4044760.1 hydantoinase B/oxoprolinase family protein [Rhodospirillaceae bacterium]MBT4688390.1 hydantoinase B/oxoprolinase family protein [Rhodospirillaceae bacterium]MBT5083585.1 hydantoinase B/oxoprolinase family protein [Rhodospirillaceae bacterium]MBT5525691.1 hydantoinase B/oxoprolinase family protein [Rhodospirillaceae bacterium]
MTAKTLDAVSVGIMWDRLVAVSDEIVSTLVRTSFSTIVSESYDLTVALLDAQGQLMAQGTYSVPVFMGTAPATLQHMLDVYPADSLQPGDVVITNDPWLGTGHTFDINVMRPIFFAGTIVAYVISITHLPDIGGLGFGAAAREIYHEGLRLPVCKLFDAGLQNDFIIELMRTNVRAPDQVIGDLMANVTATKAGETMLTDFLNEFDLPDFADLSGEIRGRSEAATRLRIADMADGIYQNEIQIEGVDGPLTLACSIEITGDTMSVDFTGTDPCVRRGINVPFCYTRAMVLYSMKCLTVPELPNNGGSVVPITVTAPTGCLLDAQPPSATGARHMIGHFVSPLVFGALAAAVPDSIQADCGMMDLMTFQGKHRDGHDVSTIYFASGGFGALAGMDGAETTPGPSNMAVVPVEVWETLTSTSIEHKALLPNSGGAGEFRGGLGQEVVIRNDSGHLMTVFCMANRTEFPPLGLMGGAPGQAREHRVNDVTVDPKGHYELAPGDRITLIEAGGGGFGDPKDRAQTAINADLAEGFITPDGLD